VRLPVRRPGGPISFGPVQAGQHVDREHGSTPVPARLSIRATVARPQSTRQGS
jgi:hypothetical protein